MAWWANSSATYWHPCRATRAAAPTRWRADLRRRGTLWGLRWWAALLFGLGGFQLYDGTIDHKVLGIHQIRYHVTIWPYDLVWTLLAVIIIAVGFVLLRSSASVR
jgi:uncharacterized membrane protein